MLKLIKANRYFFIFYLVFVAAGIYILTHFKKGDFELLINENYATIFTDTFFKYITLLGNGLFFLLLIVICAFIKFRYALSAAISFIVSGLLVQLFKHVLFPHEVRPVAFFNNKYTLHLVQGVSINFQNSFVSGHSTTIFACMSIIAFMSRNKHMGPLLCFVALSVGFSRVYLLQHFFVDVFTGAILGVLTSLVVYYFIDTNNTLQRQPWMNKNLFTLRKSKHEAAG